VKQTTKREREVTTMAMMREIDVRIERLEVEEPAANLPPHTCGHRAGECGGHGGGEGR